MENFLNEQYVKNRNELHDIFVNTYHKMRAGNISNTGIKLTNPDNNICYFLSGFNVIYRMQNVILDEIDNLVDYNEIISIINEIKIKKQKGLNPDDNCLSNDQVKKFNKYLLIQTIIEAGTFTDPSSCIEFIRKRLKNYQFEYQKNGALITYNNLLSDKIEQYVKTNLIDELFDEIEKTGNSDYSIYSISDDCGIGEFFEFTKIDINQKIEQGNITSVKGIQEIYIENHLKLVSKKIDELNKKYGMNVTCDFEEKIFKHITLDTNCKYNKHTESLLPNLVDIYGLTINGRQSPGNVALAPINDFISVINNNNIKRINKSTDDDDYDKLKREIDTENAQYILVNYSYGNKMALKNLSHTNNYKLVAMTLNCNNGHEIATVCYNNKCSNYQYIVLNQDKSSELNDLDKFDINFELVNNTDTRIKTILGAFCGKGGKISVMNILFEHNDCQQKIDKKLGKYGLNVNAPIFKPNKITNSNSDLNDYFKQKYIKYKSKYLSLKKLNN